MRVEDSTNELIVEVTDTGIGLSDADQQNLFSAFAQTDTGRGGSGLGLVLAKQLSRLLGGDLNLVSSTAAQGSRFRLQIALGPSSDPAPPKSQVSSTLNLSGLSVLFADDNIDILTSYAALLEFSGCHVDKVTNGLDAINRAQSRHFDVVLMDLQMPILDGLEATRRLRQMGFNRPILALSAHAMTEDRQRSLEAGCNDHIAKPIDIDELLVRIARYRLSERNATGRGDGDSHTENREAGEIFRENST
jgi:CheY-like chemotaxis protein